METENRKKLDEEAAGRPYEVKPYLPPTKLSEVKEPFYLDLAEALRRMQTPVMKETLSSKAFDLFKKCYDKGFQVDAVKLVSEDQANKVYKYFGPQVQGAVPVDPVLVNEPSLVLQALDAQAGDFCKENDRTVAPLMLVGRQVKLVGNAAIGRVTNYKELKKVFVVKYFSSDQAVRASKVAEVDRPALLEMLLYEGRDTEVAVEDENSAEEPTSGDATDVGESLEAHFAVASNE